MIFRTSFCITFVKTPCNVLITPDLPFRKLKLILPPRSFITYASFCFYYCMSIKKDGTKMHCVSWYIRWHNIFTFFSFHSWSLISYPPVGRFLETKKNINLWISISYHKRVISRTYNYPNSLFSFIYS